MRTRPTNILNNIVCSIAEIENSSDEATDKLECLQQLAI